MICMIIIDTDVSMLEDVSISVDTQISVTIMDEQRICPICDKVLSVDPTFAMSAVYARPRRR